MIKKTIANDTIDSFLSRNIGNYSDELERKFIALNPSLNNYGFYLPGDLSLEIPSIKIPTVRKRRTAWD